MFSVMALPAERIERIPQKLLKNGLIRLPDAAGASFLSPQPQDNDDSSKTLETSLHEGRLLQGGVVELSISGGAALGTSLALHACRYAQVRSQERYGQNVWCAFVDPRGSLYAPGAASLGVDLSRLLVVRPEESNLSRVALRLVEAQVFPVVIIDTMGVPGAGVEVSLTRWIPIVRRLSRAVEGTQSTVLLLTDQGVKRPLPLPVAQRFELTRSSIKKLDLKVGRVSGVGRQGGGLSQGACRLAAQQLMSLPERHRQPALAHAQSALN